MGMQFHLALIELTAHQALCSRVQSPFECNEVLLKILSSHPKLKLMKLRKLTTVTMVDHGTHKNKQNLARRSRVSPAKTTSEKVEDQRKVWSYMELMKINGMLTSCQLAMGAVC